MIGKGRGLYMEWDGKRVQLHFRNHSLRMPAKVHDSVQSARDSVVQNRVSAIGDEKADVDPPDGEGSAGSGAVDGSAMLDYPVEDPPAPHPEPRQEQPAPPHEQQPVAQPDVGPVLGPGSNVERL